MSANLKTLPPTPPHIGHGTKIDVNKIPTPGGEIKWVEIVSLK